MALCSEKTLQHLHDKAIETSHENILELNPTIRSSLSATPVQIIALNIKNNVNSPLIKEELVVKEELVTSVEEFVVKEELVTSEEELVLKEELVTSEEELVVKEELVTSEKFVVCDDELKEEEPVVTAVDFPAVVDRPVEYSTKSSLSESTEAINHNTNILVCNQCSKKFSLEKKLSAHIQTHSPVTFACDLCNEKFTSLAIVPVQLQAYACNVCDKSFSHKPNLTAHKRTHTGERPYACTVCDKRFSHKPNLTVHMRIHTGERPYACNVCDKSFYVKIHLKRHISSHWRKACNIGK